MRRFVARLLAAYDRAGASLRSFAAEPRQLTAEELDLLPRVATVPWQLADRLEHEDRRQELLAAERERVERKIAEMRADCERMEADIVRSDAAMREHEAYERAEAALSDFASAQRFVQASRAAMELPS